MSRSRFSVFAVTFATIYAIVYYFAVDYNLALFSYAPAAGQWTLLTHPVGDGPMMYWYGWIATSAIAAALAGLVVCWLPGNFGKHLWSGLAWLVPICSIAAIAHLLSGYFTR